MKMHQSETKSGLPPVLESFREALEGLSTQHVQLVRTVSTRARVRAIRNAHVARCGTIFFKKNFSGNIVFLPKAGKSFIKKLFLFKSHKK